MRTTRIIKQVYRTSRPHELTPQDVQVCEPYASKHRARRVTMETRDCAAFLPQWICNQIGGEYN